MGDNLQPAMPAPQPPHGLSLHARHAQQVFRVGQVGGQLRQLRVEVRLFPGPARALEVSRFAFNPMDRRKEERRRERKDERTSCRALTAPPALVAIDGRGACPLPLLPALCPLVFMLMLSLTRQIDPRVCLAVLSVNPVFACLAC